MREERGRRREEERGGERRREEEERKNYATLQVDQLGYNSYLAGRLYAPLILASPVLQPVTSERVH